MSYRHACAPHELSFDAPPTTQAAIPDYVHKIRFIDQSNEPVQLLIY